MELSIKPWNNWSSYIKVIRSGQGLIKALHFHKWLHFKFHPQSSIHRRTFWCFMDLGGQVASSTSSSFILVSFRLPSCPFSLVLCLDLISWLIIFSLYHALAMFHPVVSRSPPSQNGPRNGILHAFSSVCSFSIALHVKTQLLCPVLHEKFLDDAFPGQNKSLNSFWVMAFFVCLARAMYITVIFLSIF